MMNSAKMFPRSADGWCSVATHYSKGTPLKGELPGRAEGGNSLSSEERL